MLMEVDKLIVHLHPAPDQHQKLITSRGSPLAHDYHVWSKFVTAFVSYPAHKHNDNERSHYSTNFGGVLLYSGYKLGWILTIYIVC